MIKKYYVLLLFVLVLLFATTLYSTSQERGFVNTSYDLSTEARLALVIGNADYRFGALNNPINDKRAMTKSLKNLGFEVMGGENLNIMEMKELIDKFGRKLQRQGGVGLFYYSGHGVQANGKNYLIPIDSNIKHAKQIDYRSVQLNELLAEMDNARNRVNVLILDACRDNPFSSSMRSVKSGLSNVDAPVGTIIAFSTSPGRTAYDGDGQYGRYTAELLEWLPKPGLTIENMFKKVRASVMINSSGTQIPWESSSLVGDFYFNNKDLQNTQQVLYKKPTAPVKITKRSENYSTNSNEQLFSKGKNYYQKKEYDKSIIYLRDFVFENPNSSNLSAALYYLAESYYNKKKFVDSYNTYSDLVNQFPDSVETEFAQKRMVEISNSRKSKTKKTTQPKYQTNPDGNKDPNDNVYNRANELFYR